MTYRMRLGVVVIGIAVGAGVLHARQQAELTERDAVRVLRMVNTAQAKLGSGGSRQYGTLAELLDVETTLRSMVSDITATVATVPGYRLSLVRSSDGRAYHAALLPVRSCAPMFFTTQDGVIYQGRGLGC